jgi:hypothetical protein
LFEGSRWEQRNHPRNARDLGGDQRRAAVRIPTGKSLQSLNLNGGIWVDADSTNNRWSQVKG